MLTVPFLFVFDSLSLPLGIGLTVLDILQFSSQEALSTPGTISSITEIVENSVLSTCPRHKQHCALSLGSLVLKRIEPVWLQLKSAIEVCPVLSILFFLGDNYTILMLSGPGIALMFLVYLRVRTRKWYIAFYTCGVML